MLDARGIILTNKIGMQVPYLLLVPPLAKLGGLISQPIVNRNFDLVFSPQARTSEILLVILTEVRSPRKRQAKVVQEEEGRKAAGVSTSQPS